MTGVNGVSRRQHTAFGSGASRTRTGGLLGAIRARAALDLMLFAGCSRNRRPVQARQNAHRLLAITGSLPPKNRASGAKRLAGWWLLRLGCRTLPRNPEEHDWYPYPGGQMSR